MSNPDPDGADHLRPLMQALSLQNTDLARMLNVDRGTVAAWLADPPQWLVLHLRLVLDLRQACGGVFASTLPELPPFLSSRLSVSVNESGQTLHGIPQEPPNLESSMERKARKPPMSPADFDAALERIGWRRADFARRAGVTDNTVWSWGKEKTRIPGWVPVHLALLELVHALQTYVQPPRERKARGSP